MDYLQNVLIGEKSAVSTTSLSLSQNISLDDARQVLTEFYEAHKQRLSASYWVELHSGNNKSISIRDANDIPEDASIVHIYIVSPERPADGAVIAKLGEETRNLSLQHQISDLEKAGAYVNPILDPRFSAASQASQVAKNPAKNTTNASVNSSKLAQANNHLSKTKPAQPSTVEERVNTKQELPEPVTKPPGNSMSNKGKKETTQVPTTRNRTHKEESPIDEAPEPRKDAAKDSVPTAKITKSATEEKSPQVADTHSDHEEKNKELPNDNDTLNAENDANVTDNGESSEPPHPGKSVRDTTPRKRTRRVLKTIVTKDEEGFDVRQQVYVDESEDDAQTGKDEVADAADSVGTLPSKAVKTEEDSQVRTKRKKSPPTIKKGNQTSLMSFFSAK